jgi:hypothetical protein
MQVDIHSLVWTQEDIHQAALYVMLELTAIRVQAGAPVVLWESTPSPIEAIALLVKVVSMSTPL